MRKLVSFAAVAASLAVAPAAMAGVTIQAGPSFVQPSENVMLNVDLVPGDNVLRGTTNQTNSVVVFQSGTDNLVSPSQGQASIQAIGAGASDGLGQLAFSLQNGGTFSQAEFNVLAASAGGITLSALDAANRVIASISPTISTSGQNFFGFLADGSTPISSIQIRAAAGTNISSIGQFRLGGVSSAVAALPEPGTWAMMLIGFGMIGFSMRRKTGQSKDPAARLSRA